MDTDQITGLILAGGRGSRMGHVDKGLQVFRGAPMVLHVMKRMAPQVGTMIINANQNRPDYEAFGLPVMPDEMAGFEGPLAGLQTGLRHCETAYLVTAPCDSPFLPEELVERLGDALSGGADLSVAVTGEGESRQAHPVFMMMKTSLLPDLTAYLKDGGRAMGKWYRSMRFAEVRFPDEDAFRNINTLDDLRRFDPS